MDLGVSNIENFQICGMPAPRLRLSLDGVTLKILANVNGIGLGCYGKFSPSQVHVDTNDC
jgi:hypothetical protein